MTTINDFEISERNNKMYIRYIGTDPKIDKCESELNTKFATYHLLKLNKDRIRILMSRFTEFISHHDPEKWDAWIEQNINQNF